MGGAIESDDGSTSFEGNVQFKRNTANNGGAMALIRDSKLILTFTLNIISFVQNSAYNIGGAIYFRDDQCHSECTPSYHYTIARNISFYFINNSAGSTLGSTLYGKLNKCRPCYKINHESKLVTLSIIMPSQLQYSCPCQQLFCMKTH